jgi:hypothetical protein
VEETRNTPTENTDEPAATEAPSASTPGGGSIAGDATAWGAAHDSDAEAGRATEREWLAQLQSMIEGLTTQAAPVIRQIGAKAAELAAVAGEKAGPIAHRAAEATEHAGARIAERGREVAADLRRDAQASDSPSKPEETAEPPKETPVL